MKLEKQDANDLKNAARAIIEVLRKDGQETLLELIEACAKAAREEPYEEA